MPGYAEFAKKTVQKFYKNLQDSINEMLIDEFINEKTTIKELLEIINNKMEK